MQARMTHPVTVLPDSMTALLALSKAAQSGTVPSATHQLIHLRVSQINGCSVCVDMHARELQDAGEKPSGSGASEHGGNRPTSATPNVPRWTSPNP